MESVEALALVSGRVDEELLLRNEYLAAENEILKSKISKPLHFNDHERIRLAKIGKHIGINSFAERFVRSIKEESLNRLFFFGEESLRKTLSEYLSHYREERNHPSVSH
jgi:hypothetical protein